MSRLNQIGAQIAQSKYANVEIGSSEGLEAIQSEVAVEALQIEADMALCGDLDNVIGSLESIAEQAASSIADGGLDRQAAGMLEVSVESHMSRVGLSASDAVISVEAFGGTSTQLEATQVSVEAIKDKAKQLWEYLVKKFKEVRQKVFAWFKKVFSGAAMLKKRAEGIAKKAVDKKGTKKEGTEKIKLGSFGKALMGTDGAFNVNDLADGVKSLTSTATSLYGKNSKGVSDFAGEIAGAMDKLAGASKEDLQSSDVSKFIAAGKFMDVDIIGAYPTDYPSDTFLGGRKFVVTAPTGGDDATALKTNIDKLGVSYEFEGEAPKFKEDQEFEAVVPDVAKNIAEQVVALAEEIISFESDYFKHAKNLEAADKSALKLGDALGKNDLGSAGKAAEKVANASYSAAQKALQNPINGFTGAAITSAKAALEVCDKSLGQYD